MRTTGFGLRVRAGVEAEVDAFEKEEWEEIARLGSSGHSGHECSMQWAHRLRPSLNLGPWSPEEDAELVKLQAQHGMHSVSTPVFTQHHAATEAFILASARPCAAAATQPDPLCPLCDLMQISKLWCFPLVLILPVACYVEYRSCVRRCSCNHGLCIWKRDSATL